MRSWRLHKIVCACRDIMARSIDVSLVRKTYSYICMHAYCGKCNVCCRGLPGASESVTLSNSGISFFNFVGGRSRLTSASICANVGSSSISANSAGDSASTFFRRGSSLDADSDLSPSPFLSHSRTGSLKSETARFGPVIVMGYK